MLQQVALPGFLSGPSGQLFAILEKTVIHMIWFFCGHRRFAQELVIPCRIEYNIKLFRLCFPVAVNWEYRSDLALGTAINVKIFD